jgi:hypothetical protein
VSPRISDDSLFAVVGLRRGINREELKQEQAQVDAAALQEANTDQQV